MAMTWLHLVVPVQACKGRLCDVDLPTKEEYKAEWELTSGAAQVLGESHWGDNRGYSAQSKRAEMHALMFQLNGNLGRKDRKAQASQGMGYTPEKAGWGW